MQLITLTSDFGTKDWFVGTMKGVILGIAPRATIADVTHEIPAGDIRAGAFALAASYRFFPKGTVHVAVVDPGVGGARKAVAVKTANYFFVGPDNGVLSWALARERVKSICQLANAAFFLKPVSRTFHGRDVFAPVAAHLGRGVSIQKLGPPLPDLVRIHWPRPRISCHTVEGEVVYVDRFGNAITNIDAASLRRLGKGTPEVFTGRRRLCAMGRFFQAVPPHQAVALWGSAGLLEIAVNGGSAAAELRLSPGERVTVRADRRTVKAR